MPLRLACFGLPLAPYLLSLDGHDVRLSVLAPVGGLGGRRLRRTIGDGRVLDAGALGSALEAEVDDALEREAPDLVVSWFWTRRLPARWLERAPLGAIGVHPSLLPRHRGPDPYFGAIDAGDAESGVSVHRLTERYDDGEVVAQRRLPIGSRDAWQLARALDRPSIAALRSCVATLSRGERLPSVAQDERLASWAPEPTGEALRADFRWPTERVLRRIRALAPLPGLALSIEGLELTVTAASAAEGAPRALDPGEAAVAGEPSALLIRTGDAAVRIERATRDPDGTPLSGPEIGAVVREHLARLGRAACR